MKTRDETLANIAATILNLETLDTRNSDRLDFHELSVWQIKKALEAAFTAGQEAK
jgi:hypothetical protein